MPLETQIILSSHDFKATPPRQQLHDLAAAMRQAGADIVKIACYANDITDSAAVLSLLQEKTGGRRGGVGGVGEGGAGATEVFSLLQEGTGVWGWEGAWGVCRCCRGGWGGVFDGGKGAHVTADLWCGAPSSH